MDLTVVDPSYLEESCTGLIVFDPQPEESMDLTVFDSSAQGFAPALQSLILSPLGA